MNTHTKLYSVISYITWIGWLLAFYLRDKSDNITRRHVNQALMLNICNTVIGVINTIVGGGIISNILSIISLVLFVFLIIGIVRAFKMSDKPLPVIGEINIINN